jgi:hypothetical protein
VSDSDSGFFRYGPFVEEEAEELFCEVFFLVDVELAFGTE